MSVFSNWSHTAHDYLASAGFRLSLGQVHQILSAGLGHASLASFAIHDKSALPKARYALLDMEKLLLRAKELHQPLSWGDGLEILEKIRNRPSQNNAQSPELLIRIESSIRTEASGWKHPTLDEITRKLQGRSSEFQVFFAVYPQESIEAASSIWRWRVSGSLYVVCADCNYKVPLNCEIALPKLGRQLLGAASFSHVSQSGEPTLDEDEDEDEDLIMDYNPPLSDD